MTHGVAATAGHLADNGGIRGHSAGEVFPFVIYQQGTFNELYHWVLQPNGLRIGPFDDHAGAEQTAKRLKLRGQLPRVAEPDAVEAGVCPVTLYYVDRDGLQQLWRWRITPDMADNDRAEVTSDGGDSWRESAHTVDEVRDSQRFTLVGVDPKW